jgi:hypothetical protein
MMLDMTARPQPNQPFEWLQVNDRPVLVCPPLAAIAPHLFTTKAWPLGAARAGQDDRAWADVAAALGVAENRLVRLRQVHGARVVIAAAPSAALAEADIVLARDSALAIAVQAADCVPLLLADPQTGGVGAAHAGWRGLAQRVPLQAVRALCREFGASPANLCAAIGPSIGACCYEVGADVRQAFVEHGFAAPELAGWFSTAPLPDPRNPPRDGLAPPRADRWYFDGWAAARAQLIEAGLQEENVYAARLCTASHGATFSSYRREGASAGRIAAAIRPVPRS